ncbi:CmpA/NrtA family ABC transporter substrate-binding protein [Thioclava atlantica]|uniref:CmpA/NrtA family ABC transporter substrate-binding protein n=1 Tax=Thioclava atlantica TaxID=1317124 RepID=UPI00138E19E3|nr:CmpA/NrtA family ABC transporter substrate-binding protein [Thioclava atlantica]
MVWGNEGHSKTHDSTKLRIGFLKQINAAPIIIAMEKGFFKQEGLTVTLEPQSDWEALETRLLDGDLDASQAPAAVPLATRIGYGRRADLVVPLVLGTHGNAVTLSTVLRDQLAVRNTRGEPLNADILGPAIADYQRRGQRLNLAAGNALGASNFQLRYWLAASGISPGFFTTEDSSGDFNGDVRIWEMRAARMQATLEAGGIDGFSSGEPWHQLATEAGSGVGVVSSRDIHANCAGTVFAVPEEFSNQHLKETLGLTRALIRAARWLDADNGANRDEAAKILSAPQYVGIDASYILRALDDHAEEKADGDRDVGGASLFFKNDVSFPDLTDAVWYLTQMRRWGQIESFHPDIWYDGMAHSVFRPDLYLAAARGLVKDGYASAEDFPWSSNGYLSRGENIFIDGKSFDPESPNAYIDSFPIGLKGRETIGRVSENRQ